MSNDNPFKNLVQATTPGIRVASLAAVVLMAGCLRPTHDQGENDSTANYDENMDEMSAPRRLPSGPGSMGRLRELTQQTRTDLAARLNIDQDDITVVEARHVIWPDSSAGCPAPGFNYTQVQTKGVLILLQAGIRTYRYHGGGSGPAFECKKPFPLDPPSLHPEM